ncbi:hypothetical protein [Pseudorhodobacter wandonensis]|uniref:hypothetical protein n=1 Tax=Pseudorhodobacter wandonensis TaxID=1120568 RepID=UPI00067ABB52|nr:hypothetical protein [Pseudorhodobacter wandonensis]
MVQYLTEQVEQMRDKDYTSLSIAKAIKGRNPGGMNKSLRLGGKVYNFGPGSPDGAVDLWTAWAVSLIKGAMDPPDAQLVIIPVPNSHATVGNSSDFRTWELARRIAEQFGDNVTAFDELRWTEVMRKASEGGPRQAHELYPKLQCELKADATIDRILIDDIMTSGGHLQASAGQIRNAGASVEAALVCGRTKHIQVSNPFAMPVEELADFDPNDPFGFGAIFHEVE